MMKNETRTFKKDSSYRRLKQPKFRISSPKTVIYEALKSRGWKQTDDETDWNIHWCEREWMVEVYDNIHFHLKSVQRINHFRNSRELSRKDLLAKNVQKRLKLLSRSLLDVKPITILPKTFVLPREYALFVEEYRKNMKKKSNRIWIMKPIARAQGRGIFLFHKLSEISKWKYKLKPTHLKGQDLHNNLPDIENYVVQKYILNPLLIAGKKFDLRLYALVTSFNPLKVWIYRGGFGRFSSNKYENSIESIRNNFVHLTNVSVQKQNEAYTKSTGTKWNVNSIKMYLMAIYGNQVIEKLFFEIENVILFSLNSVEHVIMQDKRCFELFGYDIIIDNKLKPWLLEVNASPSLGATNETDRKFKLIMLNSVLDVLDIDKKLPGNELRIGGFDLVYNGNRLKIKKYCLTKSFIGCPIPCQFSDYKISYKTLPENIEPNKKLKEEKQVWR